MGLWEKQTCSYKSPALLAVGLWLSRLIAARNWMQEVFGRVHWEASDAKEEEQDGEEVEEEENQRTVTDSQTKKTRNYL